MEKEYQDAVNTVCLMCCEDTLNDENICNKCPVRKTVEKMNKEKEN